MNTNTFQSCYLQLPKPNFLNCIVRKKMLINKMKCIQITSSSLIIMALLIVALVRKAKVTLSV